MHSVYKFFRGKMSNYGNVREDETSVSLTEESSSSTDPELEKQAQKIEKKKAKEEEKQEKKRVKEEKMHKVVEKREKKMQKHKQRSASCSRASLRFGDFIQSEKYNVPLFLEKCVKFIETQGLDSEGLYRIPGNKAHVEMIIQKFEEDPNMKIRDLDVPVNAVATALKDFISKRLPPLFNDDIMTELKKIAVGKRHKPMTTINGNNSCRLQALRGMLDKLPGVNFTVLKFLIQHFVKVSENWKSNSMDSKNLAICWWPTLLPIEFNDMNRFEKMRPFLEDIVQTMIDQYAFLFCGKEIIIMV